MLHQNSWCLMKILVLSDSHSSYQFMRQCIRAVKPDAVIHLGDHYDDVEVIAEENPHLPIHQVAGNCDRYRCPPFAKLKLCYDVCGVRLYMTHGHMERVKSGTSLLLFEARKHKAAAVLYGHTHVPDCHREEDGLWVLNPGSCGYGGRSAAIIEVSDHQITNCRLLNQENLEE